MNASYQESGNRDVVESTFKSMDERSKQATGTSALHWFTLASIGASVALFIAGKRDLALFIGLWPPTIQALRASSRQEPGLGSMGGDYRSGMGGDYQGSGM
jgi:hypothetical protein